MKNSIGEGFQIAGMSLGTVILCGILLIAGTFGGFWAYAYFQPKYVAVQNNTFHQSQQYQDGMRNQLSVYRLAYLKANRR